MLLKPGNLSISAIDEAAARTVALWHYPPPYDLYNTRPEDIEESITAFLDPVYEYYKISDENGVVLAFFNFGTDARVSGGDYTEDALDIGLGLSPDLTGQGYGELFVTAVLRFAAANQPEERPVVFRVTIAAFNTRAQHLWQKAGFCLRHSFSRKADGLEFLIFTNTIREI